MSTKIDFTVIKRPRADDCGYGNSGPFVVRAKSAIGAVRMVRNRWPAYLTNHIREETHILDVYAGEGEGRAMVYASDRVGRVIAR